MVFLRSDLTANFKLEADWVSLGVAIVSLMIMVFAFRGAAMSWLYGFATAIGVGIAASIREKTEDEKWHGVKLTLFDM